MSKFPDRKLQKSNKKRDLYKDGDTTHERRLKIANKAAGNCWWIKAFLMMYPNKIKKQS
tara:strand:+ start:7536 stop:7712 length:177 start_codon:yes stop_codon:yes gene_type:complete